MKISSSEETTVSVPAVQGRRTSLTRRLTHWTAGILLVLGLLLMDRSFTLWRNDPGTLVNADELASAHQGDMTPVARSKEDRLLSPKMFLGGSFVLLSLVLFTIDPL